MQAWGLQFYQKSLQHSCVFLLVSKWTCWALKNWKVLGVIFDKNLSWNVHINEVVRSCFTRLKRYADHNRRKQLVESLILSKIYYALPVLSNANKIEINRFQKVLKSAVLKSFVTYRFCEKTDVITLKWLIIAEQINYYQLKLANMAIYEKTFPNYLKLTFKNRNERLCEIKNYHFKLFICKTIHFMVQPVAYVTNYIKILDQKWNSV